MDIKEIVARSHEIREQYHALERSHHGSEWSIEEDALAFLTDAGLVGRFTMSQQGRWPAAKTDENLKHKIGECVWWLAVLSERMNIDFEEALEDFLKKTQSQLGN